MSRTVKKINIEMHSMNGRATKEDKIASSRFLPMAISVMALAQAIEAGQPLI